jgi:hypothetical protein
MSLQIGAVPLIIKILLFIIILYHGIIEL